MDQPKIPTLKDSQKPQVKIKGLAAGLSFLDRMKQFRKKDMALMLAGLGTLLMAPLAEHFMMAPESGDGSTMGPGLGGRGAGGLFGSGSSPYETTSGLAPGGAIGGGSDVITPLNVRDPSALVMGPGAQQQPPAGSLAPQTPPPSSAKEPDLKDALANAAARAADAATRRTPLPVPKPGITGSGLRGLGAVSGGSSAGAGLSPISSQGLAPKGAAGSRSLSDVRPPSNYKGVARGPGSGSSADRLKQAAGNAADIFNRGGGSAGGALEQAAAQAMPGGGNAFGGGNGGAGTADKGPGGNNNGGSKSVGESLEFLRQKQEMEKALDLKWKMKEKRAMFPLELQQEAAKTIVMKGVVEPLASTFGDLLKSGFGSGQKSIIYCTEGTPGEYAPETYGIDSTNCLKLAKDGGGQIPTPRPCKCRNAKIGGSPAGKQDASGNTVGTPQAEPPVSSETRTGATKLSETCGVMKFGDLQGADLKAAQNLKTQAGSVLTAYNAVIGGESGCGAGKVTPDDSAAGRHKKAIELMGEALKNLGEQVGKAGEYKEPGEVAKAAEALEAAKTKMDEANKSLTTAVGDPPTTPDAYFAATRSWAFSEPRKWDADAVAAYKPAKDELGTRQKAHQVLIEAQAGLELAAKDGGTTSKAVALAKAQKAIQAALDNIESAGNAEEAARKAKEASAAADAALKKPLPTLDKYQSAAFSTKAQTVNSTAQSANGSVAGAAQAIEAARTAHKKWVEEGSRSDARQPVDQAIQDASGKVKEMNRAVVGGEKEVAGEGRPEKPAVAGILKDEQTYRADVDAKRKANAPR